MEVSVVQTYLKNPLPRSFHPLSSFILQYQSVKIVNFILFAVGHCYSTVCSTLSDMIITNITGLRVNNYVHENNVRCIYVHENLSPEKIWSIRVRLFDTTVKCLVNYHLKMTIFDELCGSKSTTVFQDV